VSVYKRAHSKYWWMYVEGAPKRKRWRSTKIPIGFTAADRKASRADADQVYHRAASHVGKVLQGLPLEKDIPTFDTFATWYDAHHIAHHKGAEREREILKHLRAAFGDVTLDALTRARVIAWRTARRATPTVVPHFGGPKGGAHTFPAPSARTVNREVDLLQQILAAAVPEHLPASPLAGLPHLEIVAPTRRMMSDAEERKILAALTPVDRAIVLAGLDGLVRLSDILDLQRADDHGATLDIRDPKNGHAHTVPVSKRLRRALDAVPVDEDHSTWYFPDRRRAATDRDRRNGFAKALQRACAAARVPYGRAVRGITFHWATRRTGATRMVRAGGEKAIAVVQRIGNWKDPSVLIGIYQDTTTAEMRAAVETVSAKARAPLRVASKKRRVG